MVINALWTIAPMKQLTLLYSAELFYHPFGDGVKIDGPRGKLQINNEFPIMCKIQ